MTLTMYDTASGSFQGGIPSDAQAILYYFDGHFANGSAARARFPHLFTQGRTVSLTDLLTGSRGFAADGCDSESGNGGVAAAIEYADGALKLGTHRPVVYTFTSEFTGGLLAGLEQHIGPLGPAGDTRKIRILPAHPGTRFGRHICGPSTCNALNGIEADGTQDWFGSIEGHNTVDMDKSTVRDDFFKPLVAPDPMLYERYDNTVRFGAGAPAPPLHATERNVVQRYDILRALQTPQLHPHRQELASLQFMCEWYRDRIGTLMVEHAPKGKRLETKRNFWGWRYYRLDHRAKGALVHP